MIVNNEDYREYFMRPRSLPTVAPSAGNASAIINNPARLWMTVLLINNREKAFTINEFSLLSGLSVGFISKFANLLRQTGFLRTGRYLKVVEPGLLLNIIRELYFFESNSSTPYYSEDSTDVILKKIKQADKKRRYALTRMCGAALVAPYVRYQLVDFYLESAEEISYWKKYLNLVDVEISGNVNVILPQDAKILVQTQNLKGWSFVNNIQLYLDLYKYPARGREQAEHLREQVLKI